MTNSTNYSINEQGARNGLVTRKLVLPVRRWWLTPEKEVSLRSWALVTLPTAAIIGAVIANLIDERLAEMLAADNGWLPISALVFFNILFTWAIICMIKTDSRRWFNLRDGITGHNDEATSKEYTMKVIAKANDWLLLYDYGEASKDNIYHDKEVQEALLAKLRDNGSKFEVNMIFKKDEQEVGKLPLIQALKQWQQDNPGSDNRVHFTYKIDRSDERYQDFNWECRKYPYHYKINDLGYAYLTSHPEGQRRRRFVYLAPFALQSAKEMMHDCVGFHNAVVSAAE